MEPHTIEQRSKWFTRSARKRYRNESSGPEPLQRAIEWRDTQVAFGDDGVPRDYLVLSYARAIGTGAQRQGAKKGKVGTYRDYRVVEVETFLREYADEKLLPEERVVHEVVDGPCKLYADVELYTKANPDIENPEALYDELVRAIKWSLHDVFDIANPVVMDLDASTPEKFSRHLIVSLDATNSVAFASNIDVGCFMEHVLEEHGDKFYINDPDPDIGRLPLPDMAVYTRRHTMRMFGAGKLEDVSRKFLPVRTTPSGAEQTAPPPRIPPDGPYPRDVVANSLITQPIRTDARMLSCAPARTGSALTSSTSSGGLSSNSRRGGGQRQGQTGAVIGTGASETALRDIIRVIPAISKSKPLVSSVRFNSTSMSLYIPTLGHDCAQRGRPHRSNCIYFLVNVLKKTYVQKCHSIHCRTLRPVLKRVPAEADNACLAFVKAQPITGTVGEDDVAALTSLLFPAA